MLSHENIIAILSIVISAIVARVGRISAPVGAADGNK